MAAAIQTNWSGNTTFRAARWHAPSSIEEAQAIVRASRKLRAIGARHSFNSIADTPEDMLALERLPEEAVVDAAQQSVTVSASLRYGRLGQLLQAQGWALHNLASLPHISVAGAVATATHGSGDRNGNLASAVTALEFIRAEGELATLARAHDPERFPGAVVALGALGVVTRLTLQVQPSFAARQEVYENLPLAQLDAHFDAITGAAYSVSLFTDWRAPRFNQVWLKRRLADGIEPELPQAFFGATPATRRLHPIAALSAEACTAQLGERGPWHERLPHFRMDFTPSSGEELQTEYFLPRARALEALHAIFALGAQVSPLLLITELRTVAADDLWLSPCYQRDCLALHFTWQPRWPAVRELLPLIEARLAPLGARPHWGKLFTLAPAQVQAAYPRLPDFQRLLGEYDPGGKFRNAFVDQYIFGQA
jgi:xylitol oxidase